jgi:hypothetical protein
MVRRPAQRQVAILAYGSLITDSGPALRPLVVGRIRCETPFPVEFGRASRRWGGGPVLVPHPAGASVAGALLVLHPSVGLGQAVELLRQREGMPSARGVIEVALPGEHLVIAASLPRNLPAPDMRPGSLARRAAASAGNGALNGIAYLRGVLGAGIRTPLTEAYAESVMSLGEADTLEEAERRLVGLARPRPGREADGLG